MVWRCWRGNDHFFWRSTSPREVINFFWRSIANTFWEIDLATISPRHDCQRAMWPPEAHKFDTPALDDLGMKYEDAIYLNDIDQLKRIARFRGVQLTYLSLTLWSLLLPFPFMCYESYSLP